MDPVTDIALTGLAKGVASVGINKIMSDYVKPKWEVLKHDRLLKSKLSQARPDVFAEYFQRTYEDNCYIRTIALRNQRQLLKALYVPLVLTNEAKNRGLVQIRINERSMESLLGKKVLIVDTAGMGKSTIMKFLCLDVLENGFGIPVLINLRNLIQGQTIIETILQSIKGLDERFFDIEILEALIKAGDFIFFFDGYDEIEENRREAVSMELTNFISKAAATNTILISSRDINGLEEFGRFDKHNIKPLQKDDAYKLIRKYGSDDIEVVENLIEDLKKTRDLDYFLQVPLLVSLLYKAYQYKGYLPLNKSDFYRQIFDALYEDHDRSKGGGYNRSKKCGLGKDDFHRALRKIGFKGMFQWKKYSYLKDEIVKLIEESKVELGLDFKASDLLDDLIENVPLIYREGNNYQWCHKSFQEYYAAGYIYFDMNANKFEFIRRMACHKHSRQYYGVLEFYCDLDESGFDEAIKVPILKEYIRQYDMLNEKWGEIVDCRIIAADRCRSSSTKRHMAFSLLDDKKIIDDCMCEHVYETIYLGSLNFYAFIGYPNFNSGIDTVIQFSNHIKLYPVLCEFNTSKLMKKIDNNRPYIVQIDSLDACDTDDLKLYNSLLLDRYLTIDIDSARKFVKKYDEKSKAQRDELDYLKDEN